MNIRAFPVAGEAVIFQPEFVEFGGEERVILSLSEALHARGRPHSVLCYHDRIDLARHARQPLRVHQLRPPAGGPVKAWALRGALERIRAMGSPTPVLFNIQSALHAGLAGARHFQLRIPDTYSLLTPMPPRGPLDPARRHVRDWATGRGVRSAQRLLTNTQALAHEMHRLYGRRAQVNYLGGHGRVLRETPLRDHQEVQLLSVSRLHASKRIDWMLRALAALRDDATLPAWRLHVAGSGPQRAALEGLAHSLGIAERVHFLGFVSDEQLETLYRLAHVFLMPARQGFGLPALEALYRRCAVVLNRESGVSEILEGTPWVLIAEAGEPAFAAALRSMLLRVRRPGLFERPLPDLPTMERWADDVIEALGW
ncbi:MAG: glycosyltransferase family 4 protein [Hydrogenophaga sp.]|jgi:glycosyltransferase involved in cell wall biosynthesis